METKIFFHQNNFGPCQHSHHEWLHKIIHVKRWNTKKEYIEKHLRIAIIGTSHV